MKRIALVAVLAVFALAPVALAASTLTGTYKTTIKNSKQFHGFLNGTWTIKFASGHYTVKKNGKLESKGTNSGAGHVITFTDTKGPAKCKDTGTYKWHLKGTKLTFTKVNDTCAGRVAVLGHTFHKAG